MKLYSFFRSSASYRVRIALALKGFEYETVSIPMRDNSHREDSYRKVNPQMRLPALELDDGTMLIQSLAIVEYLDALNPEPRLIPANRIARALHRDDRKYPAPQGPVAFSLHDRHGSQ
jgi:maleylacetoacetate isomerase